MFVDDGRFRELGGYGNFWDVAIGKEGGGELEKNLGFEKKKIRTNRV